MFAFQRDGSKALGETGLPCKIGRGLFGFEKDLQASQRGEGKDLQGLFSLLASGKILFSMCIYSYQQS